MKTLQKDQASQLRLLIQQEAEQETSQKTDTRSSKRQTRSIAICSGKGGVGKSLVALNLAIALAKQNQKVCLLDANFGLGNLDLLSGVNGYWNLSHVLTGARRLEEIILEGPAGVSILPGASELTELVDLQTNGRERLIQQLSRFEQQYDYFIIDNGTGLSGNAQFFATSADTLLLMTTLEATALADTYAALKVYQVENLQDVRIIFNRADIKTAKPAIENLQKTAQQFLHCGINVLGCIPEDVQMQKSVSSRTALLVNNSDSPAGQSILHLANKLNQKQLSAHDADSFPFIKRLFAEQLSAA